jgi:phage protein D
MQPIFKIVATAAGQAIGRDITALLSDRLLSIRITDKAGMDSDEAEISLDDRDGAVALPARGARLQISLGYQETGLTTLGSYRIDEVESSGPPQQITLRGRPADLSGTVKAVRRHAWENVSLAQVVKEIAQRNKLTPVCTMKAKVERLDQVNESDIHFITRIARQYDATASVKAGKLLVVPRGGQAKSVSGKAIPLLVLHRADIKSWRYTLSDRNESGGVAVKSHNKKTGKTLEIIVPDKDNPSAPVRAARHSVPSAARAGASAKGTLERNNRSTGTLTLDLAGRADIVAERKISLSGVKQGVDGQWVVDTITHDFSAHGWSSSLELVISKAQLKKSRKPAKQKKPAKKLVSITA